MLIPALDRPPAPPPGEDVVALGGQTMGTTWSVRAIAPPGTDPADLQSAIAQELETVIEAFSPWRANSEIARFNAAPAKTYGLSPVFWELLTAAMDLADDTNGAVDPTLGALVDLWGFGPPGPLLQAGVLPSGLSTAGPIPHDEAIEAALAVSGWQRLRLNRDAQAAVQMGQMRLDFSGIAKGHAVDRVSDRLTVLGATSHLVEIGGELRGRGVKPDQQPWWAEIERVEGSPAPRTVVALVDLALATSGDYRRAFRHDGRLYSHTLDGRTGRPIDNGLASVSVLHASAMKADAFATALTVMGPYEGPEFAEAMGLAAHFVERTERGPIERMTPAFAAMMDDDEAGASPPPT